nr:MAG TPA: hypothetical protein [Caudoviricetes sp.]
MLLFYFSIISRHFAMASGKEFFNMQKNVKMEAKAEKRIHPDSSERWVCCKQYINRWGKLMIASEYGYPYWKFIVNGK